MFETAGALFFNLSLIAIGLGFVHLDVSVFKLLLLIKKKKKSF